MPLTHNPPQPKTYPELSKPTSTFLSKRILEINFYSLFQQLGSNNTPVGFNNINLNIVERKDSDVA